MEYFKEKNGKYVASTCTQRQGNSLVINIAVTSVPLVVFSIVYFSILSKQGGAPDNTPLISFASVLIVVNLMSFLFGKFSSASEIEVDQMERTICFRKPGPRNKTISIDSVQKIRLKVRYGKAASLSLVSADEKNYLLLPSADIQMARQFADELSTLISLIVYEEST
jgi:hypothetical protein